MREDGDVAGETVSLEGGFFSRSDVGCFETSSIFRVEDFGVHTDAVICETEESVEWAADELREAKQSWSWHIENNSDCMLMVSLSMDQKSGSTSVFL